MDDSIFWEMVEPLAPTPRRSPREWNNSYAPHVEDSWADIHVDAINESLLCMRDMALDRGEATDLMEDIKALVVELYGLRAFDDELEGSLD